MKTLLLSLTLLCCSAWLAAQTSTPSGAQDPSSSPSGQTSPSSQTSPSDQTGQTDTGNNANETTIQGCLTNSGGNFMLTDASGVQYQLQGDASKLESHANQEVQVKGKAASGSSASGSSASSSDQGMGTQGTGTATTAGMFRVSKVKKISGNCTASK